MNTISFDNVVTVEYQDSVTKGWLSNIHVIFSRPGAIANYFGPGLRLALALLRDQFPPQTDVERSLVERPVPTPMDFDMNPNSLEITAPIKILKDLGYVQLLAADEQAEKFGYFLAGGRAFNVDKLRKDIQIEIISKKPQA